MKYFIPILEKIFKNEKNKFREKVYFTDPYYFCLFLREGGIAGKKYFFEQKKKVKRYGPKK